MHLSEKKVRLNKWIALLFTAIIGGLYFMVIQQIDHLSDNSYLILTAIGGIVCYNSYTIFTQKHRERQQLLHTPFPAKWKAILEQYVVFYQALSDSEKRRFETEIQIFLHETRITGIQTEVDDTTMILAAASAEIPVFGFPEWEYENLGEILIYPNAFTKDFRIEGPNRTVQGMVGTGLMQGLMILSKPALIGGFQNSKDKKNVGIHEFVHLLDAADGQYDGIPKLFMKHQYIAPWLEIIRKETLRINKGLSKMNPYGATNLIEFFAVASEYFFEHPQALQKNNPDLYHVLSLVFKQDTKSRFKSALQSTVNYRGKTTKRNALCPCNSGQKFKHCCLKNARTY